MSLTPEYLALLEKSLQADFVPHLPPLLDLTKSHEEQARKNLSRAFAAFALSHICDISTMEAAKAVIDDFDDYGIDAIYYHAPNDTVYLLQGKLRAGAQFHQQEALAFCQGVRLLIKEDFDGFNNNVQNRRTEIEDAIDSCCSIQLVVAHVGSGISAHAHQALEDFVKDDDPGDERLQQQIVDYDAAKVVSDLGLAKAYEKINTELRLFNCTSVSTPRGTYFGLIPVGDLVDLHNKHGRGLFERNIRGFLGHNTDVNAAIQKTLATNPNEFVYLNNGITALCEQIDPKSVKGGRRLLKLRGFSVINGAQTIASSSRFVLDNAGANISLAKVSLTLIKAYADGDFGKAVTHARNHQNPVLLSNFAALDDQQERLRRELAYLGFHYAYKAENPDGLADTYRIRIEEAAQALALSQDDPRYAVWLKKEPARLLDTTSDQYKALFNSTRTAFELVNAVLLNRFTQNRLATEILAAGGQQRLTYKHGSYVLSWILAKRLRTAISSPAVIDETKLKAALSLPFDGLRNTIWTKTQPLIGNKGPLALFRNQTDTIPLLEEVSIEHYRLTADPVVAIKKRQQKMDEPYPEGLFTYLVLKAPQIGNLT
jgi:hypothetical protein